MKIRKQCQTKQIKGCMQRLLHDFKNANGFKMLFKSNYWKKGLVEAKNVDVTYSSTSPKAIDSQS